MSHSWSKFYTPKTLSAELIDHIPQGESFSTIADICVGSGNLLRSAKERWKRARLIAIDVDSKVISSLPKDLADKAKCIDATNLQILREAMTAEGVTGGVDLVVANPPFGHIERRKLRNTSVLREKVLVTLYEEARRLGRIEAAMIVANISVLKEGGTLASIMPENFFSSTRWKFFRDILLKNVLKQLHVGKPQECFPGSNVRTRIFVAKLRINNNSTFTSLKPVKPSTSGIELLRGTYVSKASERKSRNLVPVFHSDTFKFIKSRNVIPNRMISENDEEFRQQAMLRMGDIVVIRVGRNCGQSAVVPPRFAGWYPTECVYVLRMTGKCKRQEIASIIYKRLCRKKRGLTTRYIIKEDILRVVKKHGLKTKKSAL